MKLLLNFCAFILIFTASLSAHARITIHVLQPNDQKFPVAVPSFVTPEGKSAGGLSKKIAELAKKDLNISGLFRVVGDKILPKKDTNVDKIDFEKWQMLEIGALVKGIYIKDDSGPKLRIDLYDVGGNEKLFSKTYPLASKTFIDTTHRIVDNIMESLTGVRGPFHSKIAAACGRPGKLRLATYDIDSQKRGGVGGAPRGIVRSPSWSPSGKSVAYMYLDPKQGAAEIYVNGRKVTNFGSTTITPAWTPSGRLVVASGRTGVSELYIVNQKGSIVRRITKNPSIDFNPSVAGGQIVFASERAGGLHLFATSTMGGGARQLTYTGYQNDMPDFSPDGSKIVFAGRDQGAFDVFIMDADGSNILRLTRERGDNMSPTFGPDSRYVAYYSSRGKESGIYVMPEDGTQETLIEKSAGCTNIDWGPWLSKN